jgi:hypothetical protein
MFRSNAIRCAAGVFGLLLVTQSFAAGATKDEELVCRDQLRPGSHIKMRVCATPEQWADRGERQRLMDLLASAAGQGGSGGPGTVSPVSVVMTR